MKRTIFLLALSLANMAGLSVAAATMASPKPRVFSAVNGWETFASAFTLEWEGGSLEITPEVAVQLRGPYNRRNVLGALLAYSPVVDERARPMFEEIRGNAQALLSELGVEAEDVVICVKQGEREFRF